ncbi:phospholipase C [Nocardioides sp. Kera G14]|uniref:phospholipase C n=1 Tax=Nocardioides sp. Kera G14 TaxID=2884264 RepID=UPI001D109E81|nr:alkaline phosphatase family protein [Nocardioides sp. Kera G14]UDY22617.1 alkaline phosphatase family protein [Nocardioides sp. Kera G14]
MSLVGGSLAFVAQPAAQADDATTTTPIKHVVVLFDENISFDHYFGTYPYAANTDGVKFTAKAGTPTPTNFASDPQYLATKGTTVSNTVVPGAKGVAGANPNSMAPFRLGMGQAWTCSQGHGYLAEQKAEDGDATTGVPAMDKFVESTSSSATCASTAAPAPAGNLEFEHAGLAMSYTDGNVVTGLWNYAQNYAMSDNSWADNFGPSSVGAVNLAAGQTGGAVMYVPNTAHDSAVAANPVLMTAATDNDATSTGTGMASPWPGDIEGVKLVDATDPTKGTVGAMTGDPTPAYDICTDASVAAGMQGKNIGDLLNEKGVSWGSFMGGFRNPSLPANASNADICNYVSTVNPDGGQFSANNYNKDYIPHHAPFQYYKSTANPTHAAPASPAEIGHDGAANHEYDLTQFYDAVDQKDGAALPAVSFLRPIANEDGHGGYSDPIDEQHFLVRTINAIQKSAYWKDTAIVIAYDDSDGFYDQVAPTIINGSSDTTANGNVCTKVASAASPMGGWQDRCGPSQRLPFLVISPYSKSNYVDHTQTSQASIAKFIESNWLGGKSVDEGGTVTGSFDKTAGDISSMFDFSAPKAPSIQLRPDGSVISAAVIPKPVRLTLSSVRITGRAKVGRRLGVSVGVSPATATKTFQWLANGRVIKGARGSTLKLKKKFKGKRVSVRVTVSYRGATPASASKTSAAVKVRK